MIKIFVIVHPKLGYLCKDGYYTVELQHSRKFNRKCDATQCLLHSKQNVDFLCECEVNVIELVPVC